MATIEKIEKIEDVHEDGTSKLSDQTTTTRESIMDNSKCLRNCDGMCKKSCSSENVNSNESDI